MTSGLQIELLLSAAVFTGARVSGLMVFCPVLGSEAVPVPVKAALTLLMTVLLHPLHGPAQLALGPWQWIEVALGEAMLGLVIGLTANFVFEAALLAGQVLGVQIGYSLANVFDPQTQADTPVLSEFHRLAALLIFLQLDVHHWLLRSLLHSFTYLPPGAALATLAAVSGLLRAAGGIFLAGVQIAAPSLVATLVADIALGFMGKASPQLPVLFIGLAVKNLVGLTVLIAAMAYWPRFFNQQFALATANASAEQGASGLLLQQLNDQRASISGVSLDEEAANLVRYQDAYSAAAKVITAINEMMNTAINMVR